MNNMKIPLNYYKTINLQNIIYLITNPDGLIYIGKAIDAKKRFKYYANLDCLNQKKLYESLIKYGIENHTIEILEYSLPKEELNEKEIYYIEKYDSFRNGLNLTRGGDGSPRSK